MLAIAFSRADLVRSHCAHAHKLRKLFGVINLEETANPVNDLCSVS
jgi:hypothetical protein